MTSTPHRQLQRLLSALTGLVLTLLLSHCGWVQAADDGAFKELQWETLIPKSWNPAADFKSFDLAKLKDSDPRAMEALQTLRTAWDNAPAEPSMDGRKVRIPGFMIPLDRVGESVKTFLLVPYFGACIHSPPPPANQMILVTLTKPVGGFISMSPVWVNGTMKIDRTDSPWGKAAYLLKASKVEAYRQ